jgi:hypothetical protein
MTERCKANPCCGEHYGRCKIPLPQDRTGLWGHNTQEYRDNYALTCFSDAMRDKLSASREKGREGWDNPWTHPGYLTKAGLSKMLREHVEKGDPVDVANFCMMLYFRGETIG